MKQDLTLKQRNWLKLYLELGNATEAAMRVYDCKDRDSASNIGWENVRKLEYADFLEEAGITDVLLQKKIIEGLEADRVKTSLTEPDKVVPDYPTRHKYLETALKLKKRLIDRQEVTGTDGEPITINVIAYGSRHTTTIPTTSVHGGSAGRPAPVSSAQLAPEGTQNNAGDQ